MSEALDRVFGHLLLVVVLEAVFIAQVATSGVEFYNSSWGVLVAFALGALGAPWTLLVPYLLTHDNVFAAFVLLLAAPAITLVLRFIGVYLRVDRPIAPLPPPD
ncbi:MAG: hypothetical protein JWN87_3177 [Frankiales bacterium]|jgi:hypothetical protein|nr:hypothetical protein [Frankiales bacterium]MCW2587135.1 hypothetical protein [Frankiales bacterium]